MSDIVRLIEQKIKATRVVEAGTLLQVHEHSLKPEQLERLRQRVRHQQDRAATLLDHARTEEAHGNIETALQRVREASSLVGDDPKIHAQIAELEDAVELTRAFQKKVERRQHSPTSPPSGRKLHGTMFIFATVGLLVTLFWWHFFAAPPDNRTPLPKDSPPVALVKQTDKDNKPAEIQIAATETKKPQEESRPNPPKSEAPQISINAMQETSKASPLPGTDRDSLPTKQTPAISIDPLPLPPVQKPSGSPIMVAKKDTNTIHALLPTVEIKANFPEKHTVPVEAEPTVNVPSTEAEIASTPLVAREKRTTITITLPKPSPQYSPRLNRNPDIYVVKQGDTLSEIAYRLFCNEPGWEILFLINKDQIQDPNLIVPNTEIRLQTETLTIENRCGEKKPALQPGDFTPF